MEITRLRVIFQGRVQGVGFRAYIIRCAQGCGISGWVQNLRDGNVEAQLQGTRAQIDALLAQAFSPPSYSRIDVKGIETEQLPIVEGEIGFYARG